MPNDSYQATYYQEFFINMVTRNPLCLSDDLLSESRTSTETNHLFSPKTDLTIQAPVSLAQGELT
jgi:hypothetical protein